MGGFVVCFVQDGTIVVGRIVWYEFVELGAKCVWTSVFACVDECMCVEGVD